MTRVYTKVKATGTTRVTNLEVSPAGVTVNIHAKLSTSIKSTVDKMATELNVPQWVVINSLCKAGLESLGK